MKTLKSYVNGAWHTASSGFRPLHDPCTGEQIAQASSDGVDFESALAHARGVGGTALRSMSFAERGAVLADMQEALHTHRDELIDVSLSNAGTTRKDAKFDIDGATGTLGYYAYLGKELGDSRVLLDGEGVKLGRSAKFWGQHVWVPKTGVAVHINAFNFPAWGWAEKAACALLAGMPVITKPATSTALLTERCIELIVEAGVLPHGALSLICGGTGNLLSLLGGQDVLAFTGSADTALQLRAGQNLLSDSVAVNIEADSLNAAVLAPDATGDTETYALFLKDVFREITQKSGQKCTAVRRIFVPKDRLADVQNELISRFGDTVVGNPADSSVNMGPLATQQQLNDAIAGVKKLTESASIVHGTGERVGNEGYFFGPTLLVAEDAASANVVHRHEVFGPVATLLPYDGAADTAAFLVALANGTLVTSVYSDDLDWVQTFIHTGGSAAGRLYLGSEKMAEQALGSGVALPQSAHGGPGRAGGGTELGGLTGVQLYMQRVALQGSRFMIQKLTQA